MANSVVLPRFIANRDPRQLIQVGSRAAPEMQNEHPMNSVCASTLRIPIAIACAMFAIALIDAPSDAYTIHAKRPDLFEGFVAPPNQITQHVVAEND